MALATCSVILCVMFLVIIRCEPKHLTISKARDSCSCAPGRKKKLSRWRPRLLRRGVAGRISRVLLAASRGAVRNRWATAARSHQFSTGVRIGFIRGVDSPLRLPDLDFSGCGFGPGGSLLGSAVAPHYNLLRAAGKPAGQHGNEASNQFRHRTAPKQSVVKQTHYRKFARS